MPIIDGQVITESPATSFAAGREAPVPYMTGGNSWECSLVPQVAMQPEKTLAALGPLRAEVMRAYSGDVTSVAQDIKTDATVTEPVRYFTRLHARHGQNAYAYFFSYLSASQRGKLHGTPHGGEILYVFDNLRDETFTFYDLVHPPATPQDRKIAEAAIGYWTNFAKTGEPGSVGDVNWPRISPDDVFMEFGPDDVQARRHFRQTQLDLAEMAPEELRLPMP
jgi:para-nitrobenzyl esterase